MLPGRANSSSTPGKKSASAPGGTAGWVCEALAETGAVPPLPILSLVEQARGDIINSALLNVAVGLDLAHLLWVFKKSNLPMHTGNEGATTDSQACPELSSSF